MPFPRAALEVGAERTAQLRDLGLDAILDFTGGDAVTLAAAAACEVWRFRFGDDADGSPPAFWQCYRGEAVSSASLIASDAAGRTSVIREGSVAIDPQSLGVSTDRLLFEAASWVALAVQQRGPRDPIVAASPQAGGAAVDALASSLLGLKIAWRRAIGSFDVFFADKWNVGVVDAPIGSFVRATRLDRVDWLPETSGLDYVADPFGVSSGGRRYALVERFDAGAWRGSIEAVERAGDTWSPRFERVMAGDRHRSYPFVLSVDDDVYCLPETLGSGAIDLYRAAELPARWERTATLVDGIDAVDATVFRHDGRWWLFCTDFREPRHHRLLAFWSHDLFGPYHPHARNPVKIDPRSAGCAGTPFVVDGVAYRPAQDCSRGYGGAVTINRILELSPERFIEQSVARIEPAAPYREGLHTLSRFGEQTLIDGKRRAFTLRRLGWRIKSALGLRRRSEDRRPH